MPHKPFFNGNEPSGINRAQKAVYLLSVIARLSAGDCASLNNSYNKSSFIKAFNN